MADLLAVYNTARRQLVDAVSGLDPQQLATTVPATPGWTVHDVVAHLASDVAGVLGNDFPATWFVGVGQAAAIDALNEWTARMVSQRRDVPLQTVIDAWGLDTEILLSALRGGATPEGVPPFVDAVLVTDLAVHSHDIYGALGTSGDRESAALRIAVASYLSGLQWWLPTLPGLQIVTEAKAYQCGSGNVDATVHISRFELFRALSGRRSPEQIRGYQWEGDPEPYLPAFAPYGVRADALVE